MKRAYADIPEGQIHYRVEGNGNPILLLHMAVASSDEILKGNALSVSKVSCRCHGFSGRRRLRRFPLSIIK